MWELISNDSNNCVTERLKVPGGWLVRSLYFEYKTGAALHHIFVSDPAHEWKLDVH